ncbi:MAG: YbjQ family protein [Granulosicoccus sp.]|nr:YbjQ family protein [Granulosicoccus sp.]
MNSLLLQALVPILLVILGYSFGRLAEKRHYSRIVQREAESLALPVIASRYPPESGKYQQVLVYGNAVISSDYFKAFLAALINIFGGKVTPYESLIDRARRESVLRMKDMAGGMNASYVFNVKFETARIAATRAGAMEVLVYGTALIAENSSDANDEV